MSLPNFPLPVKGQPVKAWAVRLQRALAPLLGITGDGKYIFVSPGAKGIRIRFNPGASTRKHFQVEKASPTSITVRGGIYKRIACGAENIIALDDGLGGTISSSEDTVTITGITADTHIITTLTDSASINDYLFPDTLTASSTGSANYPTGDTGNKIRVLAKITTDGGVIDTIEEYESGDWEDYFAELDMVSLNYVPNNDDGDKGQMQLRNFEDAADVGATQIDTGSDLIPFKDVTSGLLEYISTNVLINDALADGNIDFTNVDLQDALWTDHYNDIDHDHNHSHNDLTDLDSDDHNGPTYPYFLLGEATDEGVTKADWYTRNTKGSEDNYCGRSLFIQTNLYVDDIYDESATEKRIDVASCQLLKSAAATLDWSAKQVLTDWTGTGSFKTADEIVADNGGTYQTTIGDVNSGVGITSTNGTCTTTICNSALGVAVTGGSIESSGGFKVNGTQVVGARVIDADLANSPNTGDTDTDDLITALASVVTTHGLGASS